MKKVRKFYLHILKNILPPILKNIQSFKTGIEIVELFELVDIVI